MTYTLPRDFGQSWGPMQTGYPSTDIDMYANEEAEIEVTATFHTDLFQNLGAIIIDPDHRLPPEERGDIHEESELAERILAILGDNISEIRDFYFERYNADLAGEMWTFEQVQVGVTVPVLPTDTTEDEVIERAFAEIHKVIAPILNEDDPGTYGSPYVYRLLWEHLGRPVIRTETTYTSLYLDH